MTQLKAGVVAVAVCSLLAGGVSSVAFAKGNGHVQETIKHLEEAIQGSDNPHAKEALEHAKESMKHAEESLAHAEQASSKPKGKAK